MSATDTTRLAVLIDADNASASVVKELLEEVAKFGTATIKRAYGDWTTQNLVGWKEHLHRHAIQPMQQFAYTKGKNSTDSAFIIDAMDLLYAGNVDGFCLVSSDSDFTRLATRMREAGKVVYGLGERKTPEPFIAACDKFIFFEVLKRPSEAAPPLQVAGVPDIKELLTHAIKETSRDSGWASLSAVGSFINKNNTSFDPRNYGFTKLSELVRKQAYLEVGNDRRVRVRAPVGASALTSRFSRGLAATRGASPQVRPAARSSTPCTFCTAAIGSGSLRSREQIDMFRSLRFYRRQDRRLVRISEFDEFISSEPWVWHDFGINGINLLDMQARPIIP